MNVSELMRKFIKSDSRGMTLIESMVAMGVSAIVMAAVATMINNMSTQQKLLNQSFSALTMAEIMNAAVGNPQGCKNTFQNLPLNVGAPGVNVTQIKDAQNNIVLTGGGAMFGNGGGILYNVNFQIFANVASYIVNNQTQSTLRVTYMKLPPTSSPTPPTYTKDIALVTIPNANSPGGLIIDCYTIADPCAVFGGSLNTTNNTCTSVCPNGVCQSNMGNGIIQKCPLPGQPASCTNMVGITSHGTPVCGCSPVPPATTCGC